MGVYSIYILYINIGLLTRLGVVKTFARNFNFALLLAMYRFAVIGVNLHKISPRFASLLNISRLQKILGAGYVNSHINQQASGNNLQKESTGHASKRKYGSRALLRYSYKLCCDIQNRDEEIKVKYEKNI